MYPYANPSTITKTLSFLKSIQWGSILDGTGKTLGVINQAIPIIYQVKPLLGNAKTLLKIANTMSSNDDPVVEEVPTSTQNSGSPVFYL